MEEDVDLRCNSLHPQSQSPDDPFHDRDSQYASRDSFYPSPFFNQVQRIPTKRPIHPHLLQVLSQVNVHVPPRHTGTAQTA